MGNLFFSSDILEHINENNDGKRPAEGIISRPEKWGDDYLVGNKGCRNTLLESEKIPLSKQCRHRHNCTHYEQINISGVPQPLPSIHKTKIGE